MLAAYTKFLSRSVSRYKVHSPFIYNLVDQGITHSDPETIVTGSRTIEKLRKSLTKDNSSVIKIDFGYTGKSNPSYHTTVRKLALSSSSPPFKARMLAIIVHHFKPSAILELGTSLGIATAYMSVAAPQATITSLEGAPEIASLARKNFTMLGLQNIKVLEGNFRNTLPQFLETIPVIDFIYFDGDHTYNATLEYFELCRAKASNESVFVFDDIHWSYDMEQAWNYLTQHPQTTVSVDLFHFGILFFKKELTRQHFVIRNFGRFF